MPPPGSWCYGGRRGTSARCRPGPDRRATPAAGPGSWAGSSDKGRPPQPHRSSGRRWAAVGLGGQRLRQ